MSGKVDSIEYQDSSYIYVGLDESVKVRFYDDYDGSWLAHLDKGQQVWFECDVEELDEDGLVRCNVQN